MSPRRAVGEDNILAMLERDSARRTGSRISSLRLAWYGAAAAFAGILAGGVAWLAYDNHKSAEQLQAGYEANTAAVPPVLAGSGAPPEAVAPMLPVPAGEAPRAAVIVDESPPPAHAAAQPAPQVARNKAVPPLVMLPRQDAAPAPAAIRPATQAAPRAPQDTDGAAPARTRTAQAAARGGSDKKADKPQRSTARITKAAASRNATRTAADAGRQRRAAAAAPQVDSDVALISAIIAQSERHRGVHEAAAACEGDKCPAKAKRP